MRRWTLWVCPDCGEQRRKRLGESPAHRHADGRVFVAKPVEVLPLSEVREALQEVREAKEILDESTASTRSTLAVGHALDRAIAAFDAAFPSDSEGQK